MRSSRWQSFNPVWNQFQQFQDEMNRLFDRWGNGEFVRWSRELPAAECVGRRRGSFVEAELPGLNLKDLEIYVTGGNQLAIKGERKPNMPEKGVWHRQERAFGAFTVR